MCHYWNKCWWITDFRFNSQCVHNSVWDSLGCENFETIEFDDHFLVFILHEKADPNVFVWSSQLYDYYVYGLYTQPVLRTELATYPKNIFLKYNVFKC